MCLRKELLEDEDGVSLFAIRNVATLRELSDRKNIVKYV